MSEREELQDISERILSECHNLENTLLVKNQFYGNAAFKSPVLAPQLPPAMVILVRMSDKFERLRHIASGNSYLDKDLVGETILDTLLDLAGYALLERIALKELYDGEKEGSGNNPE